MIDSGLYIKSLMEKGRRDRVEYMASPVVESDSDDDTSAMRLEREEARRYRAAEPSI